MKSKVLAVSALVCVVAGCASQQPDTKSNPNFVVTTPVVELRPGGSIMMYGTGFAPKQEIMLLLKDSTGGMSSIGSAVKPAPVPNQDGNWAAAWDYSAYIKSVKPGTALLTVTDKDYKTLGQAPVVFNTPPAPKPEAKPEAKPGAKPAAR